MRKSLLHVVALVTLFVPLEIVAWRARLLLPQSLSVLEMDTEWQAGFAVTLMVPLFLLRRFALLRPQRQNQDPLD